MKCFRWCLIVVVLLFSFSNSLADSEKAGVNGLGFSVGLAGGNGFSFRYLPAKGLGFHAATIFWVAGGESFFNVSLEPLAVLNRQPRSALYFVPIAVALYATEEKPKVAAGIGLGYSMAYSENIWTSFELMLTAYNDFIIPLPQFAVHYMFD